MMQPSFRNMTSLYLQRDGKMLLLFRENSRVDRNNWRGIGGHCLPVEINEPYRCVIRELGEEIGIQEADLLKIELRYVTLQKFGNEIYQNYYYFAEVDDNVTVLETSPEGRLQWFDNTQILDLEMPAASKAVLKHYFETGCHTEKIYSATINEETHFQPL